MKKLLKTLLISTAVFYVTYLVIIGWGYLPPHGESGELSFTFAEFVTIAFFMIPASLINGVIYTLGLGSFSMLEKRILEPWFVSVFALYASIVTLIMSNTQYNKWFHILVLIIISLTIMVLSMNIKKWLLKIRSQ